MAKEELTQEEVFSNDIDPLDAIRELRKEEGVAEADLPVDDSDTPSEKVLPDEADEDTDEIDALLPDADPDPDTDPEPDADPEPEGEDEDDGKEAPTGEATDSDATPDSKSITDQADGNDTGEEAADDPDKTTKPAKAKKTVEPDLLKFRANGKDFEFSQEEILGQFETVFGQAMDYTQKMQQIAPYRKMISALESQGVNSDQLNLAIDALKGDKAALQKIMATHKIESFDLETDDDSPAYQPNEYGKDETALEIQDVTSKIEHDEEYKITVDVIDNQWDQDSRVTIAQNPSMIQGLHNDIKTGVYDKVAPVAMKMKVLDGNTKSDIEYYMLAGQRLIEEKKTASKQTVDDLNKPAQTVDSEFDEASSEGKRKRAATSTRARADRKSVIDYLDDDDEAYDAWYKKLQASN